MGKAAQREAAHHRGFEHGLQYKAKDPGMMPDHERVAYEEGYADGRKALERIAERVIERLYVKGGKYQVDALPKDDDEPQRLWGLPIQVVDNELTRQYGWYIVSHPAYEPPRGPGGRGEGLTGGSHA